MKSIVKTLAYLIIFVVFTAESIEVVSCYFHNEAIGSAQVSTSAVSPPSVPASETSGFTSTATKRILYDRW